MKRFLVLLTFYTLIILSVSMLSYYYLLIKPSLGKLEANLVQTAADVDKLDQTVTAIKLTTDRLEAKSSTFKLGSQPNVVMHDTVSDATESSSVQALDQVNQAIDQHLQALTPPTAIGGLTGDKSISALTQTPDPTPPTDMALGFITVSSSLWPTVDVYQATNVLSPIVSQLKYGNVYPFLTDQSDWYQVRTNVNTTGWVQKSVVKLTHGL
jgi:hypothetical protein